MIRISHGIYLVRTQAGFRKAIKTEFSEDFGEWKTYAKNVCGFPVKYPSVVSLSVGYKGYTCFVCNSVDLETLKGIIKDD